LEALEDRNVLAGFGLPGDLLLASVATPPLTPAQVATSQPTIAAQATSHGQPEVIGLSLKLDLTGDASSAPAQQASERATQAVNFSVSLRIAFGFGDSLHGNADASVSRFGQLVRSTVHELLGFGKSDQTNPGGDNGGGNTGGGNTGGSSNSGVIVGPIGSGSATTEVGPLAGNSGFFVLGAASPASLISNSTNSIAGTTTGRLTLLNGTTTNFVAIPDLSRAANGLNSVAGVGGEANDLSASNQTLGVNVVPRSGIAPLSAQVGGAAEQEEEDDTILFEEVMPNDQPRQDKPDILGIQDFLAAVPESRDVTLVSNVQVAVPGVLESALGETIVEVKEAGGEVSALMSEYRLESWMAGLVLAGSMLEVARRRSQDEEEKTPQQMPNRRLNQPKDE